MLHARLALLTRNYNLRASHVRQVASRKPKAYMRVIGQCHDSGMTSSMHEVSTSDMAGTRPGGELKRQSRSDMKPDST